MIEKMPEFQSESGAAEGGEVNEQDVARVRESIGQAKQMRDTIKKTQHQNAQYAKLLALLLMHVEDDELLAAILRQVVEYKLPVVSVFGQFLPLVQKKMDVTPLKPIYEMLRGALESYEPSRAGIENRFAAVQDVFGELKTVDADEYTAMVRRWMDVEGISNNEHELGKEASGE